MANTLSQKKAVSKCLKKRNYFCVAHTLILAVKYLYRERNIGFGRECYYRYYPQLSSDCFHFKHSTKSSYALLNNSSKTRTRWNSNFYMLERLLKVKIPISATFRLLEPSPSNLDSNEWLLIEDVTWRVSTLFRRDDCNFIGRTIPKANFGHSSCIWTTKRHKQQDPSDEIRVFKTCSLAAVTEKQFGIYNTNRAVSKAFLTHALIEEALLWKVMPIMSFTKLAETGFTKS